MTLELKLRKVLSICISPALTLFTWKKKPNLAVIAAISFSLMAGLLGNIVFAPAARAATTTFNCDGGTYTAPAALCYIQKQMRSRNDYTRLRGITWL